VVDRCRVHGLRRNLVGTNDEENIMLSWMTPEFINAEVAYRRERARRSTTASWWFRRYAPRP
jgi:hypothetical protein